MRKIIWAAILGTFTVLFSLSGANAAQANSSVKSSKITVVPVARHVSTGGRFYRIRYRRRHYHRRYYRRYRRIRVIRVRRYRRYRHYRRYYRYRRVYRRRHHRRHRKVSVGVYVRF